ncbi:hypothetical protein G1O98_37975, partial [Nostoc sp. UIC10630]|nr:hypothetical protein [Nostoc sp. UIC 10630]
TLISNADDVINKKYHQSLHLPAECRFLASACGWRSPTAGACAIAVGEDGQYFGQEW